MTIEAIVSVLVDSRGSGICRSCHARLTWYETVGGKRMPFTGSPGVVNVRRDQTQASAPWIGDLPRAAVHWATCPDADQFRQPRAHR